MRDPATDNGEIHLPVVTQIELDCIRVAGTGASSKVIARKLGLSYNTVNVYASRVRRILGAADRHEAAEMLRRYDAGEHLNKFILNSEAIEPRNDRRNAGDAFPASAEMAIGSVLREDRAVFDLTVPRGRPDRTNDIGRWGRDNELTGSQRLWWILKTTVLVMLSTFLAFAAVQSLDSTLTKLGFIN